MFQIISDGSCDLSQEQLREAGVEIVPYYVSLDGETYLKEVSELDVHTFFEYCVSHRKVFPRTSMPTLEDYKCAFERALHCGLDVLCYCLTEKFSGSFSCATIAAAMLAEDMQKKGIRLMRLMSAAKRSKDPLPSILQLRTYPISPMGAESEN